MPRRFRAAASVALSLSVALLAEARVAAASPRLRVEWPVVPGCPASSVVSERALAAVGQAKQVDDVLAIAEITPPASGPDGGGVWRLRLRTRTARGAGERNLEAPSCDALARAAGLLVALAALRTRAPSGEPEVEELPPAPDRVEEPGAPVAPLRSPTRSRARRAGEASAAPAPDSSPDDARFVLAVGVRVAFGLLPRAAPGPTATLGYEVSGWSARAGFLGALPQDESYAGLGATFSAIGVSLDVCRRLPVPEVLHATPRGCAGVMVEGVRATGSGGVETFASQRTASTAFAGLGADWSVSRTFRVGLDARLGASLVRPTFIVDSASEGERVLHRSSAIRAEAILSLGAAF